MESVGLFRLVLTMDEPSKRPLHRSVKDHSRNAIQRNTAGGGVIPLQYEAARA